MTLYGFRVSKSAGWKTVEGLVFRLINHLTIGRINKFWLRNAGIMIWRVNVNVCPHFAVDVQQLWQIFQSSAQPEITWQTLVVSNVEKTLSAKKDLPFAPAALMDRSQHLGRHQKITAAMVDIWYLMMIFLLYTVFITRFYTITSDQE